MDRVLVTKGKGHPYASTCTVLAGRLQSTRVDRRWANHTQYAFRPCFLNIQDFQCLSCSRLGRSITTSETRQGSSCPRIGRLPHQTLGPRPLRFTSIRLARMVSQSLPSDCAETKHTLYRILTKSKYSLLKALIALAWQLAIEPR